MPKEVTKPSLNDLEEILGSKERVLFFLTWLKHDRNATKAYLETHPGCSEHSARVGGSRVLANIDTRVIMNAYGINHETYFQQLKDGSMADKWNDFTGEREPDHKTRLAYHDKVGKLLNIETPNVQFNQQINIGNVLPESKYGNIPSPKPEDNL